MLVPFLARGALRGAHDAGSLLERLAEVQVDPPLIAVGLGVAGHGATGWRCSCLQALRAIHVGVRTYPSRLVHHYAELAVYDAKLRSPDITDGLCLVARKLLADETWSMTVMEYFRHGARTRSAARALNVYPNTLLYRLHKVERLLRGRFDDPDWPLQVQLAVKLLAAPAPGERTPVQRCHVVVLLHENVRSGGRR
ncbi:MAG: PucR family transcriptional regulator [Acidimicrobiales bacterium]